MQPQPVASFAQPAASSGAVSKGGPVRLTGSKRPLGCASSSGASLAPASGGPRESPGRANPTCGLNPMHNEASHKRNRQNQNTPISSNLAISFSNISHLGATRSSSWRWKLSLLVIWPIIESLSRPWCIVTPFNISIYYLFVPRQHNLHYSSAKLMRPDPGMLLFESP